MSIMNEQKKEIIRSRRGLMIQEAKFFYHILMQDVESRLSY